MSRPVDPNAPACVYEARNSVNGKHYAGVTGQSLNRRAYQHRKAAQTGSSCVFHKALRKYGAGAFVFTVRAVLPTYAEAQIAERVTIAFEHPAYNMSAGGEGALGVRHTEATRAKMRLAKLGKVCTAQERANMSAAQRKRTPELAAHARRIHTGLKRSPETCDRISASLANKPRTPAHDAASLAHHEYRHSEATRAKISAALKSSDACASHMKRVHSANTGAKRSAETRAKMSASAKAACARRKVRA